MGCEDDEGEEDVRLGGIDADCPAARPADMLEAVLLHLNAQRGTARGESRVKPSHDATAAAAPCECCCGSRGEEQVAEYDETGTATPCTAKGKVGTCLCLSVCVCPLSPLPSLSSSPSSSAALMSATAVVPRASINARLLHTHITRYNADVVATLPQPTVSASSASSANPSPLIAVGQYELEEETRTKRGCISLCSVDADIGIQQLQCLDWAAVFDLRWRPQQPQEEAGQAATAMLAVADAAAALTVLKLQQEETTTAVLVPLCATSTPLSSSSSSALCCLSVAWAAAASALSSSPAVAVSLSDGSLRVHRLSSSHGGLYCEWSAAVHSLEAWCCCFSPSSPQLLYSGGDDCSLIGSDTRSPPAASSSSLTTAHTAGVTSLLASVSARVPYLLVSGSYDERLRLWDERSWRRPLSESERLGGGVWRLSWRPQETEDDAVLTVCAACMHAGVKLLRLGLNGLDSVDQPQTVSEYCGHSSIAYGCDWLQLQRRMQRGNMGEEEDRSSRWTTAAAVASCSFYDRSLHVWQQQDSG
jgi:diphthamide biosynthesis protein 7